MLLNAFTFTILEAKRMMRREEKSEKKISSSTWMWWCDHRMEAMRLFIIIDKCGCFSFMPSCVSSSTAFWIQYGLISSHVFDEFTNFLIRNVSIHLNGKFTCVEMRLARCFCVMLVCISQIDWFSVHLNESMSSNKMPKKNFWLCIDFICCFIWFYYDGSRLVSMRTKTMN